MARLPKDESKAALARIRYGAFLKRQREACKLTQKHVADELGFGTPQLISNWERGIAVPAMKEISKLARLYQVERDHLVEIMTAYHEALSEDNISYLRKLFDRQSSLKKEFLDS